MVKSEENNFLWKFTPDNLGGGSWSTVTPANKADFDSLTLNTRGAATFCPEEELGFLIGGFGTSSTDLRFQGVDWPTSVSTPGMLRFDAKASIWSNESTTALSSPLGAFRTGEAICVSGMSPSSVVFALGGQSEGNNFNSFTNITFYHTKSKAWLWQTATGDIPLNRELFCAVGFKGRNGTYEMYSP